MKKIALLLACTLFLSACHCNCQRRKCASKNAQNAATSQTAKTNTPAPKSTAKPQAIQQTTAGKQAVAKKSSVKAQDFAGVAVISTKNQSTTLLSFKKPITFKYNSDEIAPDSAKAVRQTARALRKYPNNKIVVAGYTDSLGNAAYNVDLSERRAKSVANMLILTGVKEENVTTVGYGAKNPLGSNKTSSGRAKNRRVEIEIAH